MSFAPTAFRPFARSGWGGKAAGHFRGALATDAGQSRGQSRGQIGTVVYRSPGVVANTVVSGITRDSSGTPIGPCVVHLFSAGNDMPVQQKSTDASGNFTFEQPGSGPFYIVAYKTGSPDIAGTTVNTLIAI